MLEGFDELGTIWSSRLGELIEGRRASTVRRPMMRVPYVVVLVGIGFVATSAFHLPATPLAAAPLAVRMAGFGAGAKSKKGSKDKPAAAKISMKRQWERFQGLVGGGEPRVPVFARIPGDAWIGVGDVACAAGVEPAAAVQLHKRLILEHATRVSAKLAMKSKELECGYTAPGADDPALLVSKGLTAADAANAGFEGAPDASARYSSITNVGEVKKMGVGQEGMSMGGY